VGRDEQSRALASREYQEIAQLGAVVVTHANMRS
jgi:hypothetical protein